MPQSQIPSSCEGPPPLPPSSPSPLLPLFWLQPCFTQCSLGWNGTILGYFVEKPCIHLLDLSFKLDSQRNGSTATTT